MRHITIRKISLIFLCFFFTFLSSGQILMAFVEQVPRSWWLDKPIIRKDTLSLVSLGITQIKVYEIEFSDSGDIKKLLGIWSLQLKENNIISSKWESKKKSFVYPMYTVYKKNKIIETFSQNDRVTHFFDRSGKIVKSKHKIKSYRYEDFPFDRIMYNYVDGLLVEASYYCKGIMDNKKSPYSKILFEYEK